MNLVFKSFFALILTLSVVHSAESQTTGKKKWVDPKTAEAEKEAKKDAPSQWGWGINLGNIYFTSYTFEIGLDPNVAYKLDEALAVGFMLKMNYYYQKDPYAGLKYNAFDLGPTLFTRYKPLMKVEGATPFMQGVFLQFEYEHSFVSRPQYDAFGNLILNDDGTKILSEQTPEDFLYIGLGFSSGYPFASFVSFHYNLLDDISSSRVPFTYRIGFTWNY